MAEEQQQGQEVAHFEPPRLPWHPRIEQTFGIEKSSWKALCESVFPAAQTTDAIVMALSYCKARKLDPFKRPVNIVPMWDAKQRKNIETVWPGINELRTTAMRTSDYAGVDAAEFGPDVETTFRSNVKNGQSWEVQEVTLTHPSWCRHTAYRMVQGQRMKFVGPRVRWLEAYASKGRPIDGSYPVPNAMWAQRIEGQLEKCSEAAMLRMAFPEEVGNEFSAEEMAGQAIGPENARDITPVEEKAAEPQRDTYVQDGAPPAPETGEPNEETPDNGASPQVEDEATEKWPIFDHAGEEAGEFPPPEWTQMYIELCDAAAVGAQELENFITNNVEALRQMTAAELLDNEAIEAALEAARVRHAEEVPPADEPPIIDGEAEEVEEAESELPEDLEQWRVAVPADADGPNWAQWYSAFRKRVREAETKAEVTWIAVANQDALGNCPKNWRDQATAYVQERKGEI